jgi:hypothetical protein
MFPIATIVLIIGMIAFFLFSANKREWGDR